MFNAISVCFFSMAILHLMDNLQGGTALSLVIAVPIALVLATLVFLIFQFKASGILFGLTYLILVLPNMNEGTSVINLILMSVGISIIYFRNNSRSLFYASAADLYGAYKPATKIELILDEVDWNEINHIMQQGNDENRPISDMIYYDISSPLVFDEKLGYLRPN